MLCIAVPRTAYILPTYSRSLLPTGSSWFQVPAGTTAACNKAAARLASMGGLRILDGALRLLAQHGTSDDLEEV